MAYNAAMERSLEDKLFFLGHTAGAMTFVDFGCANGSVLQAISERRKGKTLVGIDCNPMQLAIAGQKVPEGVFVLDFETVEARLEADDLGPKVAILSSVLHEAPELAKPALTSGLFDYVVVRDMGITTEFARSQARTAWCEAIRCNASEEALEAWRDGDKTFDTMGEVTEFLLKYPYLGNSDAQTTRELSENYPMVGVQDLVDMRADYTEGHIAAPVFFEHYSAPWVVDRIRQDFGFEFPYPTHFKMILKKVAL